MEGNDLISKPRPMVGPKVLIEKETAYPDDEGYFNFDSIALGAQVGQIFDFDNRLVATFPISALAKRGTEPRPIVVKMTEDVAQHLRHMDK